jgi:retron-type reverse transcriptase
MKSLPAGSLRNHATYANLYAAHLRAREKKTHRPEVIRFERNLNSNLFSLLDELLGGTYSPPAYREFKVHEPKERTIHALPYRDRVVHQWYVHKFIIPFFVPRFIEDSFACILDRGTHGAQRKTQKALRQAIREYKDPYVLKMDISGFFYNIDKDVLFRVTTKKMKDKPLVELTRRLIYDGFSYRGGIPIGNYTSQYFANIYMNELDQFVKRVLKIKHYMRYMDDFIAIVDGKETARQVFRAMEDFINSELKIELNSENESCYCRTARRG